MPPSDPPIHWLDVLRASEQEFDALSPDRSYSLYTLLVECFQRIAPVDSFYVCLYAPAEEKPLLFVYNIDADGFWEEPERHPLRRAGEGPTSTVIHTRRSFVLDKGNALVHNGALNFGETERVSLSAVHVPILIYAGTSQEEILGVLSSQSYNPDAYSAEMVRALEWLADRAGRWLDQSRKAGVPVLTSGEGDRGPLPQVISAVELADVIIRMLNDLGHQAEQLLTQVPEKTSLWRQVTELNEECRRVQAEALQLPWRLAALTGSLLTTEMTKTRAEAPSLALTPQERKVLEYLDQWGETDALLARRLGVQVSTLKFHLRNLYLKLDVENRTQAVQKYRLLFVSSLP